MDINKKISHEEFKFVLFTDKYAKWLAKLF